MTPSYELEMFIAHSWAPVPGTFIYPGLKTAQMFATFPGPGEEDKRTKNEARPQAQDA
jgi:hypothetical protein